MAETAETAETRIQLRKTIKTRILSIESKITVEKKNDVYMFLFSEFLFVPGSWTAPFGQAATNLWPRQFFPTSARL